MSHPIYRALYMAISINYAGNVTVEDVFVSIININQLDVKILQLPRITDELRF